MEKLEEDYRQLEGKVLLFYAEITDPKLKELYRKHFDIKVARKGYIRNGHEAISE